MDPICHTLVGATLAQAGLKRWSPRATATLIISANVPDLDVVALAVGRGLELRRGPTHGLPALLLWPFVLAALIWAWDRWRPGAVPVRVAPLTAAAAIGVITHPFLDYLNNYGLRWLSPVRDWWFYGDTLFIVDPWLYLLLGGCLWVSGRRERSGRGDPGRPARIGGAAATCYIGLMLLSTSVARTGVGATVTDDSRFMATAVFLHPFTKQVVIARGPTYRLGRYRLLQQPHLVIDSTVVRPADFEAAIEAAARTRAGRAFLHWSRLPMTRRLSPTEVRLFDLRYSTGVRPSFASLDLVVPDRR